MRQTKPSKTRQTHQLIVNLYDKFNTIGVIPPIFFHQQLIIHQRKRVTHKQYVKILGTMSIMMTQIVIALKIKVMIHILTWNAMTMEVDQILNQVCSYMNANLLVLVI